MIKKILITLILISILTMGVCYAKRAAVKKIYKKAVHKIEQKTGVMGILPGGCYDPDTLKKYSKKSKNTFTLWTIQLKAPAGQFILDNIEEFKQNHPEIEVVWVDIPIAEAQKRTLASVLSGNPPDLINLNPDFSSLLAQKGILEYFNEEDTAPYHPELIEKLKFKGKVFALPFYATSPVTVYNNKVLSECFETLPEISTYEDIYKISKEIKQCTSKPSIVLNLNENDTFAKILNKYGVTKFQRKEEFEAALNVFKMFDEMYKEGYLPKDTLTINHREAIEQYMAGNASVIVAGSNFIKMVKENAPEIYNNSKISNQLTAEGGKFDVSLMNFVIPKNAKNKEFAKEFALQITNSENQLKFAKLTNTLPANAEVLKDEYFTNCPEDIIEQSRCVGAKQLDNLTKEDFGYNNKKAINDSLNKALEETLLGGKIAEKALKIKVYSAGKNVKSLIEN